MGDIKAFTSTVYIKKLEFEIESMEMQLRRVRLNKDSAVQQCKKYDLEELELQESLDKKKEELSKQKEYEAKRKSIEEK